MARYTGPNCRLCRAGETKLFLKGERCMSDKCAVTKMLAKAANTRFRKRRRKDSDYALQLKEKQKVRRTYGVLEKQFRRMYEIANRTKGKTGDMLLISLERRLDNVVYRMGFLSSRKEARQYVRHGHVLVNGRRVSIPSFQCSVDDEVKIVASSANSLRVKESVEFTESNTVPKWIEVDREQRTGKLIYLPARDDIDADINEQMIVEYYSR